MRMRLVDIREVENAIREYFKKQIDKGVPNEWSILEYSADLQDIMEHKVPIVCDIDKVVEQLKQNTHDLEICEEQFDMNRPYFKDVSYKMIKLEDAIKIIKAGVKYDD